MLSIIVPVFNEGSNIAALLESIRSSVAAPFEVIIAFDDDNDDTLPTVKEIKNSGNFSQPILLVKNEICRGPSGAIRTAFKYSHGSEILVTMADLSDDHTQIQMMRNFLKQGYDIVAPSRYCSGGRQELNSIKAWIPRFAGLLLHWVAGFPCRDATNSYRLYSRRVWESFWLKSTHSFSVTLELTAKAHCLGYRIKEIPTVWKIRTQGSSKFPFLASLFSYLPWFAVGLSNGRFLKLPLPIRKRLVAGTSL